MSRDRNEKDKNIIERQTMETILYPKAKGQTHPKGKPIPKTKFPKGRISNGNKNPNKKSENMRISLEDIENEIKF